MIRFGTISGAVLVDDRRSCQEPYTGLTLPIDNEGYIIFTGDSATVTMTIHGEQVQMGNNSILYVRTGARPEHARGGSMDAIKLALGKIWAFLEGGKNLDEAVGNCAVGVRG
jgi:hypothetical protein